MRYYSPVPVASYALMIINMLKYLYYLSVIHHINLQQYLSFDESFDLSFDHFLITKVAILTLTTRQCKEVDSNQTQA